MGLRNAFAVHLRRFVFLALNTKNRGEFKVGIRFKQNRVITDEQLAEMIESPRNRCQDTPLDKVYLSAKSVELLTRSWDVSCET